MAFCLKKFEGKVAIVTGASAGIGASICEELVKNGMKVVGFARRKENVQELAKKLTSCKGVLHGVKVDITNETDIKNGFAWTLKNVGPVDVLVNNAGVLTNSSLLDGDITLWKKILDTNVLGLSICTREAYMIMNKHNICGHILHINSVAGHGMCYIPNSNMYSPSKHALTALTELTRRELIAANSNIKVTSISPGFVTTEILGAANYPNHEEIEKTWPALEAVDIANAVLYVLSTPQRVNIQEIIIRPQGEMF